jgi:hypothetical protein
LPKSRILVLRLQEYVRGMNVLVVHRARIDDLDEMGESLSYPGTGNSAGCRILIDCLCNGCVQFIRRLIVCQKRSL